MAVSQVFELDTLKLQCSVTILPGTKLEIISEKSIGWWRNGASERSHAHNVIVYRHTDVLIWEPLVIVARS